MTGRVKKSAQIQILRSRVDVHPYIDRVQSAADEDRNAFGFLPKPAYSDFAIQRTLFVAVAADKYVGHLAFGGRFPHLKIRQLNVVAEFRGRGLGKRLFAELRSYAESHNYLTIRADVADDLPANTFWEKAGLILLDQRPGGKTRDRKINIRELLLGRGDLLSAAPTEKLGERVLLVDLHSKTNANSYALDINILLDAVRRQGDFHKHAMQVIAAALKHRIVLALTPEADVEMLRSQIKGTQDPLYQFASNLPRLPSIERRRVDSSILALAAIVFPSRTAISELTPREYSDLSHLAYCAELRMRGFVTRDEDLLSARDSLRTKFGIEVTTPADLIDDMEPSDSAKFTPQTLDRSTKVAVRKATQADLLQLETIILEIAQSINVGTLKLQLDDRFSAIVAQSDGINAAVAWGTVPTVESPDVRWSLVFFFQSADNVLIADQFLAHIVRCGATSKLSRNELAIFGGDYEVMDHLKRRGCLELPRSADSATRLLKLVVTGFVDANSIEDHFGTIGRSLNIDIAKPPQPKTIQYTQGPIGSRSSGETSWFDLAKITGPVLYLFPYRCGLLVPIVREYADELLGGRQGNVFAQQSAILRTERVYFRAPTKLEVGEGMPVIFRESKRGSGSGAAIGCARLTDYGIYDTDVANLKFRSQGVLDLNRFEEGKDSKNVGVLSFDNFQEFPTPISLPRLQKLKAVRGNGNITAEKLAIEMVRKIVELGFGRGR